MQNLYYITNNEILLRYCVVSTIWGVFTKYEGEYKNSYINVKTSTDYFVDFKWVTLCYQRKKPVHNVQAWLTLWGNTT